MPIQTAIDSISQNQGSPFGFKNRIINGGMVIDQRNAGASVSPTTSTWVVDRWQVYATQSAKGTAQQNAGSVTPPAGFKNYIGFTSSSAYSVISSDIFAFRQQIEGNNISDLDWGTSNAKPITISFWVRSSLTGTFTGGITNQDQNRSYGFAYTINASNTWEYKTITILGDTTGTWKTDNTRGLDIFWSLGTGSTYVTSSNGVWLAANDYTGTGGTSVVGTNGATFYMTGVQVEVGRQASSFDFRSYTNELQLCQRYYLKLGPGNSFLSYDNYNSTSASCVLNLTFPVAMRVTPTGSYSAIGDFGFFNTNSGNFGVNGRSTTTGTVGTDASGTGRCQWYTNNANAFAAFIAEL